MEKNTNFPRIRLNQVQADTVTNQQICINCDSVLKNSDYCVHCCFHYDRKPGATMTGGINQSNAATNLDKQAQAGKSDGLDYSFGGKIFKKEKKPSVHHETRKDGQGVEENRGLEGWKIRHQLLSKEYSSTTKEKRVCKKCNFHNAFFKIDCAKCKFKFTKTRADRGGMGSDRSSVGMLNPLGSSGMNTDNYSVYFWELLQVVNDRFGANIASLISEYLEEKDFSCVRDLYKRIKEILSQENTERIFGFSDTNQLLELHDFLDELFERVLTDNEFTTQIFKDATKKRVKDQNPGHVSGPSYLQSQQDFKSM